MQIDRIFFPTKTLGFGNRLALWTIGCPHQCQNCSNPELWAENPSKDIPIEDIVKIIAKHKDELDGVTITGGEPFYQVGELLTLLEEIDRLGIGDVLVYTGYTLSALKQMGVRYQKALTHIGVLIDGTYDDDKNDNKGIRGSSNQKIYVLREKLSARYKDSETCKRQVQTIISDGNVMNVGVSLKAE